MSFREALAKKDFVITAELPLTPDATATSLVDDARVLEGYVDGILLTDNQYGRPHMAPSAAASILLGGGFDPIMQLSCRNRNRIALLGELLGASALGVETLMLVRGSALPGSYKPRPKAVIDIGTKELIAAARRINDDEMLNSANKFLIGGSGTVHDPKPDWRPEELTAKVDAGLQLITTQLCHDTGILRNYMDFLVQYRLLRRLNVIVSVAIILSGEVAEWLRETRRRTIIPEAHVHRLKASANREQDGVEMCSEMLRDIAAIPGVSGVNFIAAGNLGMIPEIVRKSGIKET
jgi:methylenetetrahydrofolate reductase (NADH)